MDSNVPARSPYQPRDWVRHHGYSGHPPGLQRWGFRGYVTGSLGATILTGVTDDGRDWAEYWGALELDGAPRTDWNGCTCCSPRRQARPADQTWPTSTARPAPTAPTAQLPLFSQGTPDSAPGEVAR